MKLGYGGTAKEMYRLLEDATKLDAEFKKTAEFSLDEKGHLTAGYADIVKAIHIIQKETGIYGTTSKEAFSTIQGSMNMTKSAWQNLLVGFADPNQDLGKLVDNLATSATYAIKNIGNRIVEILPSIATGFTMLFEKLIPIIVSLTQTMLPDLLQGAIDLFTGLVSGFVEILPQLMDILVSLIPEIITTLLPAATKVLSAIFTAIIDNLPLIIDTLVNVLPSIVEACISILLAIGNGIAENLPVIMPSIMKLILEIVRIIYENLPLFIESAQKIIAGLIEGFVNSTPDLLLAVGGIVATIWEGFQQIKPLEFLKGVGEQITEGLWEGIVSAKDWILGKIKEFIGDVTSGLKSFFGIQDLDTSITTPDVAKYEIQHSVVSPNPETLPEYQLNKSIQELNATMKNGDAKVNIENTRDVRRAVNA